jgi:hypothetical protein
MRRRIPQIGSDLRPYRDVAAPGSHRPPDVRPAGDPTTDQPPHRVLGTTGEA